jgi:hypothetical protein
VILAGLLTLYKLASDSPGETELKILGTLAASFLWVIPVDLFSESHGSSPLTRGPGWLAGIAAIALLFHFQWEVWFAVSLLFGAVFLGVGLSAISSEASATHPFGCSTTGSGLPPRLRFSARACSGLACPSSWRR